MGEAGEGRERSPARCGELWSINQYITPQRLFNCAKNWDLILLQLVAGINSCEILVHSHLAK